MVTTFNISIVLTAFIYLFPVLKFSETGLIHHYRVHNELASANEMCNFINEKRISMKASFKKENLNTNNWGNMIQIKAVFPGAGPKWCHMIFNALFKFKTSRWLKQEKWLKWINFEIKVTPMGKTFISFYFFKNNFCWANWLLEKLEHIYRNDPEIGRMDPSGLFYMNFWHQTPPTLPHKYKIKVKLLFYSKVDDPRWWKGGST